MIIIAAAFVSLALAPSHGALPQDAVIAGKDPNKIVCKADQNTGSRLQRRRICRTRAEWEQVGREQRRRVDSDGSPFRDEGVSSIATPAPR